MRATCPTVGGLPVVRFADRCASGVGRCRAWCRPRLHRDRRSTTAAGRWRHLHAEGVTAPADHSYPAGSERRGFGVAPHELAEREAADSTGVGHGVALPHARLEGLERMRGVFVRLEQPVDFESIDDQPVDLLFALFAPKHAGAEHLRALARVSRLLRQSTLRQQLRQARAADVVHALLVQEASARPSAA